MDDAAELTPLDPRYKTVLRINAAIWAAVLLVAATVGEAALDGWTGLLWIPVLAWGVVTVGLLPIRRYRARGYRMDADQLRIVQGVWFHWDTTVPFGRIQHIDVHQGPIERANGIASLVLHTAGTDNSSVELAGLAHGDALVMRDRIRAEMRVNRV